MFRIAIACSVALALAACSSGSDEVDADGDGSISTAEAETAASKVRRLEAGEYKMSMELLELEDPSMEPNEIEQAKQFFSAMGGMAPASCMSEEEANEGLVGVAEGMQQGDCTMESLTSNEDGMKGAMTCKGENGPAKVTMDTTSTGTESEMTMRVVEPNGRGGDKTMAMKVTMTRTGDCTPEG